MKFRYTILAAAGAVAILAASAAPALTHDPAAEELTRRVDALASASTSQSAAIDDLYELVDGLKARLDSGAVTWDQNAEVSDLYTILDRMADTMRGGREATAPAPIE